MQAIPFNAGRAGNTGPPRNIVTRLANATSIATIIWRSSVLDGRTISVPLVWYPRLLSATPEQLANWRIAGVGFGFSCRMSMRTRPHFRSIKITQDVRDYAATHGIAEETAAVV